MENFKSFGGKLTIPLMEGYMAVTGPNGSGKSNITDAILFVLGPKSSKAVRAGRLTDLIFDGGKSGSKAKYMKVSLVFDNVDRLMPWNDDVVRLTRYVKISENGNDYSSYFFVNETKSSLTEFDSLLTKARISADGYNLVQQGDVTRIVQMGNLERRRVLDSISGISSYDADIDKAEGEKAEAVANIERITIVIDELKKQLARLEKDREDARKYIETQGSLEMAKAQLVHRQLQIEESKLESIQAQIAKITEDLAKMEARKTEIRTEAKENEDAIISKESEIAARIGPDYRKIKDDIETAKVRMATEQDRSERAVEDRDEQETFRAGFDESIHDNDIAATSAEQSLADIKIKLDDVESRLKAAKDEDKAISEEMSSHGGEHTKLQKRLSEVDVEIDAVESEEHEAQVRAAKAETITEECRRGMATSDERVQSATFEIKDSEWNLKQIKEEAGPVADTEAMSNRILELRRKESEYEKQEGELRDAISRLDREYNELMVEKKASDRANSRNSAVSAILGLRDKGEQPGIHGTIQELAVVEQGYETALAVAAGGKMMAVVVDDDAVAAECITYLKKEKLGRVTFLPLTKMAPGKPRAKAIMCQKQTEGYATDLIDYDPKYTNAFWFVFQDTLVVRNMDDARALMGGVRLVTRSGELIEASGAMVGGTISQQQLPKFGASSQSEMDNIGSKLRAANASMDTLRVQLREIRDQIRAADDEMRKAASGGADVRGRIAEITAHISELKKSKQSAVEDYEIKKKECDAAEKELAEASVLLSSVSAKLNNLRDERTKLRDRIKEIAPADVQEKIAKIRDRVYELTNVVSELKQEKSGLETEIIGLAKQKESLEQQKASVVRKIEEDTRIIEEHEAKLEEAKTTLAALRAIETEMESRIEGLKTQKDELVEKRYRLDAERNSLQEKIETKNGVLSSNQAQVAISASNIEQLNAEISQLTVVVEQPIPSEEELRRTIRSCENIIARIGNVNLRAIDDYDERKQRFDSLTADVSKLEQQIKELTELTDSLSAQKKGLFMKSYNAVDENFKAIYAQLSGGGEAYMGLEDEDDPFNGGLQINAKPKNGKMLRLEALSGGEKTLTALSFIFAIQEYQPSPFYVLDEVDMFLDAVNAELVARRVKESSAKAQFIQVSLRKVTLALADHLIGVTRPPNGISKVIMQPDMAEVSRYEAEAMKDRPQE